eukprot:scaffold25892_cov108-Phaeocystis_antarctica.AAC.1
MRPELAGEQIDEDCTPAICDCDPDYFVKVPLRGALSECCGYTYYEPASSSAETNRRWVLISLCVLV